MLTNNLNNYEKRLFEDSKYFIETFTKHKNNEVEFFGKKFIYNDGDIKILPKTIDEFVDTIFDNTLNTTSKEFFEYDFEWYYKNKLHHQRLKYTHTQIKNFNDNDIRYIDIIKNNLKQKITQQHKNSCLEYTKKYDYLTIIENKELFEVVFDFDLDYINVKDCYLERYVDYLCTRKLTFDKHNEIHYVLDGVHINLQYHKDTKDVFSLVYEHILKQLKSIYVM